MSWLVEQAHWQTEHHRAEKEEIKRRADVLKRWARLVKGLQIRRRLQAQYQRTDAGADLHGGDRDTDIQRKPTSKRQIAAPASTGDLELGSVLQGSHDVKTVEDHGSDAEVHHPSLVALVTLN